MPLDINALGGGHTDIHIPMHEQKSRPYTCPLKIAVASTTGTSSFTAILSMKATGAVANGRRETTF